MVEARRMDRRRHISAVNVQHNESGHEAWARQWPSRHWSSAIIGRAAGQNESSGVGLDK